MTSNELFFASENGKEQKRKLGIPEGYNHVCTIALAYKNEETRAKPRRKEM